MINQYLMMLFALIFITVNSCAQTSGKNELEIKIEPMRLTEERNYIISKVKPKYIDGSFKDLHKSIFLKLKYPNDDCIEGITVLTFEIPNMLTPNLKPMQLSI